MQLSIIIVNYNVKYFLEQCLSSVIKAVNNIDAEIFVVDNNSADGSNEFFINRFSQVKFIWKNENIGFAKANNEALQLASGDKILFLNPDTIVPEDCFVKCLAFFSTAKNIGTLGVRMIDGGGCYLPESKRGFPSSFTSFCKMSGLTKLFPHSTLLANYYLGHLPENEINEVDVLSGAFMMTNKKILDKVGSFDEAFFMYGEDIDLSYRIQKAGFKNYYFPGTTILHFKGESTKEKSSQYIRNFYGAMVLFVNKHYDKYQRLLFGLILQIVIAFKTSVYRIQKLFKNPPVGTDKHYNHNVLVIGEQVIYEEVQQIINPHFGQVKRIDKIDNHTNEGRTVVLCEPSLSFSEMIMMMQYYKASCHFFVHSAGTKGVVGSMEKSAAGTAIGRE